VSSFLSSCHIASIGVTCEFTQLKRRKLSWKATSKFSRSWVGIPTKHIRYDNPTGAITAVVFRQGTQRQENDRWVLFRSHYGFDPFYCQPGIAEAHEKGRVEGEVGWFRRNRLSPWKLNDRIRIWEARDERRRINDRIRTIGQDFAAEQAGESRTGRTHAQRRLSGDVWRKSAKAEVMARNAKSRSMRASSRRTISSVLRELSRRSSSRAMSQPYEGPATAAQGTAHRSSTRFSGTGPKAFLLLYTFYISNHSGGVLMARRPPLSEEAAGRPRTLNGPP
jgi:hypothetical protein